MELILASASPRRSELLQLLDIPFKTRAADLDESVYSEESPRTYVERMALEKARRVQQALDAPAATWVLGSDTTVVLGERILGKPVDETDGLEMLRALSGTEHQVLTAVALCGPDGLVRQRCSVTRVRFHPLCERTIRAYWKTGEPADKAGAYGIQGRGARFVSHLEGSYHAVMGLPVDAVAQMLTEAGFELWPETETVTE